MCQNNIYNKIKKKEASMPFLHDAFTCFLVTHTKKSLERKFVYILQVTCIQVKK